MNRSALITGGTRGIGFGIATALCHEGYDVVVCGRRHKEDVASVISTLQKTGRQAWYIQADLANPDDRKRLVVETRSLVPRLHVLVNNAGMAPRERNHILEASEKSFEEVMRVNLQGPYFLTQLCAHWMIAEKKEDENFEGCVVNINSISSTVASVSRGEYCISKAGVSMATKLWAIALADHDIPVYEIRPGITATDMTSGVKDKYDRLIQEGLLLQPRWGTPEDIGKTVVSLARQDIPYATGQVIVQDGGLTLERL